jgi:hypothetical protein
MHRGKVTMGIALAAGLACSLAAFAQQPSSSRSGGSTEGRLTVTLTVVSSVGLVGPDGEQRMIVANAVDPKDNVSRLQPVVAVALRPVEKDGDRHVPQKKKKTIDHR